MHQYNVARSATSTHGHRSPSSDSLREPVGEPLLPGVSPVPEDSISLFAQGSSIQETGARGVSVRYPSSIDLDVEPCLSRPQVDTHAPGFSENLSYVSDLLQVSKRKEDSASFHNMSEQLLLAEGEARSTTSLPPSHSVAHWLKETNNKIRGSGDANVLKPQGHGWL